MHNLNDDFFNRLENNNPKAINVFRNWLDQYKTAVGWDELFMVDMSFSDLPYEMQIGIIGMFDKEYRFGKSSCNDIKNYDITQVELMFKEMEKFINI